MQMWAEGPNYLRGVGSPAISALCLRAEAVGRQGAPAVESFDGQNVVAGHESLGGQADRKQTTRRDARGRLADRASVRCRNANPITRGVRALRAIEHQGH